MTVSLQRDTLDEKEFPIITYEVVNKSNRYLEVFIPSEPEEIIILRRDKRALARITHVSLGGYLLTAKLNGGEKEKRWLILRDKSLNELGYGQMDLTVTVDIRKWIKSAEKSREATLTAKTSFTIKKHDSDFLQEQLLEKAKSKEKLSLEEKLAIIAVKDEAAVPWILKIAKEKDMDDYYYQYESALTLAAIGGKTADEALHTIWKITSDPDIVHSNILHEIREHHSEERKDLAWLGLGHDDKHDQEKAIEYFERWGFSDDIERLSSFSVDPSLTGQMESLLKKLRSEQGTDTGEARQSNWLVPALVIIIMVQAGAILLLLLRRKK